MNKNNSCIFCKIANKEIDSPLVFENEHIVAFPDIHPKAKTHLLVIPKEHIERLTDLHDKPENEQSLLELWQAVLHVAHETGIEDACKIQINNGEGAGQEVPHLHVHLLSDK